MGAPAPPGPLPRPYRGAIVAGMPDSRKPHLYWRTGQWRYVPSSLLGVTLRDWGAGSWCRARNAEAGRARMLRDARRPRPRPGAIVGHVPDASPQEAAR